MSDIVRVAVKVYEDGVEVGACNVGYYHGQPYRVEIVSPDGVDWRSAPLHADARRASPAVSEQEEDAE